jgi:arylsulfatase A-like enzyme
MVRNLSRRSFLRTAALSSAGLAFASKIKGQPAKLPRKPNLIVFLPDQQRADTIACYGNGRVHSPNLNKLTSQSFVFEQAYVTQPVCSPSRSSLMTGMWPHATTCTYNNTVLPAHLRCLPELIGDADYRCAYFGKWQLGDEVFAQHGFHEWASIIDDYQKTFSPGRDRKALSDYNKFLTSKGIKPDKKKKNSFSRQFASRLPIELSKPRFLETKACDFLERHASDPFVLFVAFFEPHPPYNGPLNTEHSLDQIDLDPTVNHVFNTDIPLRYRLRQQEDAMKFGTSADDYRRVKQRYLGLVTEVDQSIGATLLQLEKLGIADNTIVVHTSDHGDMMGAHRLFGKYVMYQEAARVPYLVRMPNQRQTVSIPQAVSHIDFVPTILDLLGQSNHAQLAGTSRSPLLRGESMLAETVFLEWGRSDRLSTRERKSAAKSEEVMRAMNESTRAAITPDGWKICLRDTDKNELYNLRLDPGELENLYYRAESKELIARLSGQIHRWQEGVGDTLKV